LCIVDFYWEVISTRGSKDSSREEKFKKILLLCNKNGWQQDGTPDKGIAISESDNAVTNHLSNHPNSHDLKQLTIRDIVIMSTLANSLQYIRLDPHTVPDPFEHNDNYDYSIIVDRESSSRIVAICVFCQTEHNQ
jgi:hypothetical protein